MYARVRVRVHVGMDTATTGDGILYADPENTTNRFDMSSNVLPR